MPLLRSCLRLSLRFMFVVAAAGFALGCGRDRPPDDGMPGGARGPDGGSLTFDAAMLARSDAGPIEPDAGETDLGPPDLGPPDLGTRVCRGVALSCYGSSRTTCESQRGCAFDEGCEGSAASCSSQRSSYSCNALDGCYWSSSTSRCSGSARSCRSLYSSSACRRQDYCRWAIDCTGVSTACSLLTEYECELQSGCYVDIE